MESLLKPIYVILIFLGIASCGNEQQEPKDTSTTTLPTQAVQLVPCPPIDSAAAYPDASMQAYNYQKGKFTFGVQNFVLGSHPEGTFQRAKAIHKKGNYLHLVLNNKTHHLHNYRNFVYAVPDGRHLLFAFLSRSFYESVKRPEVGIAREILVKNKQLHESVPYQQAALALNAPRGLYKNEATKDLVLDFFLFNTNLVDDGYQVKVLIDEKHTFFIQEWKAHYIRGLGLGVHNIVLELIDQDGKRLFGPVSEKFILTEEPEDS